MAGNARALDILIQARDKASPALDRVGKKVDKLRSKNKLSAFGFLRVAGPVFVFVRSLQALGSVLGNVIQAGSEFNSQILRAGILSNASAKQLRALRDEARALGRDTRFTAGQVAEGMSSLALQGFRVEQNLNTIKPALDLAAIGMVDVKESASLLAGVLRGMRLETNKASEVADTLAAVLTTSANDMETLKDAFKTASPAAATFGVNMGQLSSLIGVLANNMIRGERGGTALRNIMLRLQAQPQKVGASLKQLNVQIEDSSGNMRDMWDILRDLQNALKGYSDSAKGTFISNIAGFRAFSALNVILGTGVDRLQAYQEEMKNTASVGELAADITDTLTGDVLRMSSAFESVKISVFSDHNVQLRVLATSAKNLLNEIDKWVSINNSNLKPSLEEINELSKDMTDQWIGAAKTLRVFGNVVTIVGRSVKILKDGLEGIVLAIAGSIDILASNKNSFIGMFGRELLEEASKNMRAIDASAKGVAVDFSDIAGASDDTAVSINSSAKAAEKLKTEIGEAKKRTRDLISGGQVLVRTTKDQLAAFGKIEKILTSIKSKTAGMLGTEESRLRLKLQSLGADKAAVDFAVKQLAIQNNINSAKALQSERGGFVKKLEDELHFLGLSADETLLEKFWEAGASKDQMDFAKRSLEIIANYKKEMSETVSLQKFATSIIKKTITPMESLLNFQLKINKAKLAGFLTDKQAASALKEQAGKTKEQLQRGVGKSRSFAQVATFGLLQGRGVTGVAQSARDKVQGKMVQLDTDRNKFLSRIEALIKKQLETGVLQPQIIGVLN